MSEEKINIVIEYLGLNVEWIPDCGSDIEKAFDKDCVECGSYSRCLRETTIRKKLKD